MYLSDLEKQHILSRIKIGDDCWEWTGAKIPDGYGVIKISGKSRLVHRLMVGMFGKTLTKCCLHTCDNPICCNPKHLFEGTQLENIKDRTKKKREGMIKLTREQAHDIKHTNKYVGMKQSEIAALFNVSQSTISYLKSGRNFKYL